MPQMISLLQHIFGSATHFVLHISRLSSLSFLKKTMATLSTNLNSGRQKKEDHERDKGEILDSAENTNAVRNNILLNVLWNNIYDVYFHCGVSKSGLV